MLNVCNKVCQTRNVLTPVCFDSDENILACVHRNYFPEPGQKCFMVVNEAASVPEYLCAGPIDYLYQKIYTAFL